MQNYIHEQPGHNQRTTSLLMSSPSLIERDLNDEVQQAAAKNQKNENNAGDGSEGKAHVHDVNMSTDTCTQRHDSHMVSPTIDNWGSSQTEDFPPQRWLGGKRGGSWRMQGVGERDRAAAECAL